MMIFPVPVIPFTTSIYWPSVRVMSAFKTKLLQLKVPVLPELFMVTTSASVGGSEKLPLYVIAVPAG